MGPDATPPESKAMAVDLWNKEGNSSGHRIARDQKPENGDSCDHADLASPRDTATPTESPAPMAPAEMLPVGDLLHLLI